MSAQKQPRSGSLVGRHPAPLASFLLMAGICLALFVCGLSTVSINIWKHRYPFYGGYGGGFGGGYGGYGYGSGYGGVHLGYGR